MSTLLLVDDEPNVLYSFRKGLARTAQRVLTAECGEDALHLVRNERPNAVVLDIRLPDVSGLDVFDQIHALDPRLPVIIVTAYSTTNTAIDAMKRGAFEYLLKPVDIHQLQQVVARAVELNGMQQDSADNTAGRAAPNDAEPAGNELVGQSEAMQEVYKSIGRVAPEDVTVLILGESGTGKELVARALHEHSPRHRGPFLAINCAALPESLLESELFGHERGAFSGAEQRRIGRFEQAHSGTLFLDEIGDMSTATQAKLLRVLQDGRLQRVGGVETIETDVRVIAATNQNLDARIAAGDFRRDLLYRLNGFTIHLPPLRERLSDLPLLIEHFLRRTNPDPHRAPATIVPDTMRVLERYSWPGNVRELQSVIQYAAVHAVGQFITPDCLPAHCHGSQPGAAEVDAQLEELQSVVRYVRGLLQADEKDIYRRIRSAVDRIVVREVLRHEQGNQVHASDRLGISRNTLRSKLSGLEN